MSAHIFVALIPFLICLGVSRYHADSAPPANPMVEVVEPDSLGLHESGIFPLSVHKPEELLCPADHPRYLPF